MRKLKALIRIRIAKDLRKQRREIDVRLWPKADSFGYSHKFVTITDTATRNLTVYINKGISVSESSTAKVEGR